jgi:hypothetical protein
MPVIINGSTGISGTDGSAANPAVQGSDTNTGMFFPAPDTIAFAEGGVESMRLDSSGNVSATNTVVMGSSFLRNRFINGDMEIAQRGTSGTTGYVLDRWVGINTTAQSQSSDAPTGFINSLEFSASTATFPFVTQRIERFNSYDFAGRTVTLSLWAKNVSGSATLYAEVYRANANDNFSSVTSEGIILLAGSNPSSSWTYYSGTVTLSANATTGIEVRIIRNDASASTTRITGLQLEVGTAATPFERRQFGQELMLCQRYYADSNPGSSTGAYVYIAYSLGGSGWPIGVIQPPVTMRAAPTVSTRNVTLTNASSLAIGFVSASYFYGSVTVAGAGAYTVVLNYAASAEL